MPIRWPLDQLPHGVVGGVQPGLDPALLLGAVAGARPARPGAERLGRRGQQEVDGVLGPVVEGVARGLGREALVAVGALAVGVRQPLHLGVEGDHDVAGLGQRLGGVPVQLLGGLDRAVGDHDGRALARAGARGPHAAGHRGAVARGPQHALHQPVAAGLPLVQADVARARQPLAVAQVGQEVALGIAGRRQRGLGLGALALQAQLHLVAGLAATPARARRPWPRWPPRARGRTRAPIRRTPTPRPQPLRSLPQPAWARSYRSGGARCAGALSCPGSRARRPARRRARRRPRPAARRARPARRRRCSRP